MPDKAPRISRRLVIISWLVAAGSLWLPACGDGQPPWCEDLDSLGNLGGLASAVAATDGTGASEELERFRAVAANAPDEISADMEAIANTLSEVVDIALSGDGVDADALELRREAANEQLALMPEHIASVSGWAEEECGIRLD